MSARPELIGPTLPIFDRQGELLLPPNMDDNGPPVLLKNRAPARPWTAEEDALLRVAVAKRETHSIPICMVLRELIHTLRWRQYRSLESNC
jgi:hypothetical protein